VQKFVLETSYGVRDYAEFMDLLTGDAGVFRGSPERKVALGWYLREVGARWASI